MVIAAAVALALVPRCDKKACKIRMLKTRDHMLEMGMVFKKK